jgi:hypothetical protein
VLNMKALLLTVISTMTLTSCSGGGVAFEFYVVTEPEKSAAFIAAVTTIAKENDMDTAVGHAVSDAGNTLTVLEGRGRGLRLWVQNTLLSGKEDPMRCGVHTEPHPDPSQFTVFTKPNFFGSTAGAEKLGQRVLSQLERAGFDVRREPAVCGQAAIGKT